MSDKTDQKPKTLPGGITERQLEGWKKKHGDVYKVEVETENNGTLCCYLKAPSRDQYGVIAQVAQKKTGLAGGFYILNDCWLGGDDLIKKVDKIYVSAAISAMELFDFLPSSISKL